ncbi:MAG: ATP synthase A1 subunit C [Methanomassiliicoccaceae archaeon]|jgi:V/A-type H+-transporting ATPase subunit C|nr:ATP synthase A1 subunit C [Methanomassiliicoccaceae archaeon]
MFGRKGSANANYAAAAAKVKAKKAALMGDEAYAKMLMMSLPEISRFIGESGYQKEMEEFAGRIGGIDLIEHATYRNMARTFSTILLFTQGELRQMVSAYLTKWDLWNLKVILRGKTYGVDIESIKEDLVPAGKLDEAMLERLLSLDTDKEIIAEFEKMKHLEIAPDVINTYKADGHLRSIEDYLDKLYYKRLLRSIDPSARPKRLFQDFVRKEIDTVNLETILILKAEGIRGDDVMEYIIPGGKQIDKKLATQLANAESISAMANDLAQLDFYEDIKEALDAETKSLKDLVAGMKKYHIGQAKKFSHLYPLSVIPVLDYMIHKKIEVDNIRTIARGIESGIDRDTIKGLLVM